MTLIHNRWIASFLVGFSLTGTCESASEQSNPSPSGSPPAKVAGEPEKLEVVKENYPTGQIKIERSVYRDATGTIVNHGLFTMYAIDGTKIGGGEMRHGKRQGHWARTFRKEDSLLFQVGPLSLHSGPFFSEADFVDGEIEGAWTIKSANGAVISSWGFSGGRQQGDWVWNYSSGRPEFRTQYTSGKQHGIAEQYDPTGKVVETKRYIDGRELVRQSFTYPNGVISCEGTFLTAREKLQTTYDWWQGQAETLFYGYVGGREKHGKFVWNYPSGRKKIEGEYTLGQLSGTWTFYNEDGTIQKTETIPALESPKSQDVRPKSESVPTTAPSPKPQSTPTTTAPLPTGVAKTTAPTSTGKSAPSPENELITPEIKPAPGERPVDKQASVEPGVEQKTPAAPTIATVAEVKVERETKAAATGSAKPAAKRSPIQVEDK